MFLQYPDSSNIQSLSLCIYVFTCMCYSISWLNLLPSAFKLTLQVGKLSWLQSLCSTAPICLCSSDGGEGEGDGTGLQEGRDTSSCSLAAGQGILGWLNCNGKAPRAMTLSKMLISAPPIKGKSLKAFWKERKQYALALPWNPTNCKGSLSRLCWKQSRWSTEHRWSKEKHRRPESWCCS